jgi:16S rRNA (guanine527-N7)-methyltransferase
MTRSGEGSVSRETTLAPVPPGHPAAADADERARAAVLERHPAAAAGLRAYADLLCGAGVERGLIGPREVHRIWQRHLGNSVAVAELVPAGSHLVDVGSGAGLPGLALALVRPDLSVLLVEPLLRRATFLGEAAQSLGLVGQVTVIRARAEALTPSAVRPTGAGTAHLVLTARAVAPLDRLVGWTLPLIPVGGELLALKGDNAEQESTAALRAVRALGGSAPQVLRCGQGLVDPPATVVRIVKQGAPVRGDRR